MRAGRHYQPLSYDIRLPDEVQADALRLLDASRAVVNAALVQLWPSLDAFMEDHAGPAWKQVGEFMGSPDPHGNRQWRCESETAGRIMRAQAERKQVFLLVQPVLTEGFIRPEREKRPAGKNRQTIKAAISVGLLTYAGDDGGAKGQSYRLSFDKDAGTATLRFRFPDAQGHWQWCTDSVTLTLPDVLVERLKAGGPLAPTLRELIKPDGSRVAVLDVIVQVKSTQVAWTGTRPGRGNRSMNSKPHATS